MVALGWCRLWPFFRIQSRFACDQRVHLRVWPNHLDLNGHVNKVAISRSPTLAASIGSCVPACWGLHDGKALPIIGDAIAKFRQDLTVPEFRDSHAAYRLGSQMGIYEHRFVRNDRVIGSVGIRRCLERNRRPARSGFTSSRSRPFGATPELPDGRIVLIRAGIL